MMASCKGDGVVIMVVAMKVLVCNELMTVMVVVIHKCS